MFHNVSSPCAEMRKHTLALHCRAFFCPAVGRGHQPLSDVLFNVGDNKQPHNI